MCDNMECGVFANFQISVFDPKVNNIFSIVQIFRESPRFSVSCLDWEQSKCVQRRLLRISEFVLLSQKSSFFSGEQFLRASPPRFSIWCFGPQIHLFLSLSLSRTPRAPPPAFLPPRTIKILGEGRPRGPPRRGNRSRPDY